MKVIIAGGGTGGHLFPGIAVADEFRRRDPGCRILFIGTERGIEKKVLPTLGYDLQTLDVAGIKGMGILRAFKALGKIPRSFLDSWKVIKGFNPDMVLGVGGYASGPVVLMAHMIGIPTAVAEQNALPGLTNRILGGFVDRVFLSFEETKRWFATRKTLIAGNPIRAGFTVHERDETKSGQCFTILVFGGSQGAMAINRTMMDAARFLKDIRGRIRIIHQTGPGNVEDVSTAYRAAGIDAEVYPFIMDMAKAYDEADILICRAGATSIAEITAAGKAAILIPFPYAVADHQTKNARLLTQEGAAEMIPEHMLTGEMLAGMVHRFFDQPDTVRQMANNATRLGHPKAAADIVDACMDLLQFSYDRRINAPN
ncbi:MAG: undecaprenyldiphospho-muramoylpentapeptide beta-N-acetylglucosaminyltransferase [Syntrophales bacterium]